MSAEIPVIIKAVDQLTAPVQKMAADSVTSLKTVQPAGVGAFNAVTDSAKGAASGIAATGAAAASAGKAVAVGTATAATGARAATTAFIGLGTAIKTAFGITALLLVRRAVLEVGKFAIESSGATEQVDRLNENAERLKDTIGQNIFGPYTAGGQALITVFERLNSIVEKTNDYIERHPRLMDLASKATGHLIDRWTMGITAAEEFLAVMEELDRAQQGWWQGGDNTALRNNEEKLERHKAMAEEFDKIRAATYMPGDYGLGDPESEVDKVLKVINATEAIEQAYNGMRLGLTPIMDEISFAAKKMWSNLSGAKVPAAGEPGEWSGPGSGALNPTGEGMDLLFGTGDMNDQLQANFDANVLYREMDKQNLADWADFQEQEHLRVQAAHNATIESFGSLVGNMLAQRKFDLVSMVQWVGATIAGHFKNAAAGQMAKALEFKSYAMQYGALAAATFGTPTSFIAARQASGYLAASAMAVKDSIKFAALGAVTQAATSIGAGALAGAQNAASGRGGGSYSGSSGGYRGGGATGPIQANYRPAAQERGSGVVIQIMGNVIGQREYIDRLADQIAKRVGDGARIGVMA